MPDDNPKLDRLFHIMTAYHLKATNVNELAMTYNVTPQRIRQLIKKAEPLFKAQRKHNYQTNTYFGNKLRTLEPEDIKTLEKKMPFYSDEPKPLSSSVFLPTLDGETLRKEIVYCALENHTLKLIGTGPIKVLRFNQDWERGNVHIMPSKFTHVDKCDSFTINSNIKGVIFHREAHETNWKVELIDD